MYLSSMNDGPLRIFIGSSSEGERYADAATDVLQHIDGLDVTHWRDAFQTGSTFIEDLLTNLDESDFGIFVFSRGDSEPRLANIAAGQCHARQRSATSSLLRAHPGVLAGGPVGALSRLLALADRGSAGRR
jgi:hypothetical protein